MKKKTDNGLYVIENCIGCPHVGEIRNVNIKVVRVQYCHKYKIKGNRLKAKRCEYHKEKEKKDNDGKSD